MNLARGYEELYGTAVVFEIAEECRSIPESNWNASLVTLWVAKV